VHCAVCPVHREYNSEGVLRWGLCDFEAPTGLPRIHETCDKEAARVGTMCAVC
jgi:hypothetical protein